LLVLNLHKEQGARSKEQGARSKEQGARSKEQGASFLLLFNLVLMDKKRNIKKN